MSAKSNNFKLGLFIFLAMVLFVFGIIIFGSGSFVKPEYKMETYFNTSVQGIDVGSKVKFRGVIIGEVTAVDFTHNRYKTKNSDHGYILIEMAITKAMSGTSVDLEKEIDRGLRARMSAQGITGVYFIEFDYGDPVRSPALPIDWTPANDYIPSAGTSFQRIVNSLDDFLAQLQKIDFGKLVESTERFASTANATIAKFPTQRIGDEATSLIAELRTSNERLKNILDSSETERTFRNLAAVSESLRRHLDSPQLADTLAKLNTLVSQADHLLAGKDGTVDALLESLRATGENLRSFSEDLRQNPSRLLRGTPPPELDK